MSDKEMYDKSDKYYQMLRSHQIEDFEILLKYVSQLFIAVGIIIGLLVWLLIFAVITYIKVGV